MCHFQLCERRTLRVVLLDIHRTIQHKKKTQWYVKHQREWQQAKETKNEFNGLHCELTEIGNTMKLCSNVNGVGFPESVSSSTIFGQKPTTTMVCKVDSSSATMSKNNTTET